jgi:CheY-like chemotaxis protein
MAAVLMVDSSCPYPHSYVDVLRASGFDVVVVPTVEDACTVVDDVSPEIVMAHVRSEEPSSRGIEIATYLRTQPVIEDIPLVLLTESLEHADAAAVVAAGCDCYLRVPIPSDQLVREVRQMLDHSRRLRQPSTPVLMKAVQIQKQSGAMLERSRTLCDRPALVTTDKFGHVVRLNDEASGLLNISPRGGVGRNLLVFVGAERDRASRSLARAAAGQPVHERLTLRPRERKAVTVEVGMAANGSAAGDVDWTFEVV